MAEKASYVHFLSGLDLETNNALELFIKSWEGAKVQHKAASWIEDVTTTLATERTSYALDMESWCVQIVSSTWATKSP